MIKMNEEFKRFLEQKNIIEIAKKPYEKCADIISKTQVINECVLYNDDEDDSMNFEWLLEIYTDLTGIEANINEIDIWYDELSIWQLLDLVKILKVQLESRYISRKFCIIFQANEDFASIRFHIIRSNEPSWIDENIELYHEPIAVNM